MSVSPLFFIDPLANGTVFGYLEGPESFENDTVPNRSSSLNSLPVFLDDFTLLLEKVEMVGKILLHV